MLTVALQSADPTICPVARDLSHAEAHDEDNLLIEAVSLLVQRQRETEAWVSEQIEQADERAASVERQYAALESRLASIEEQLDSLVREVDPGHGDAIVGQRLARLREQVADLRSESDGRPLHSLPTAAPAEPQAPQREPDAYRVPSSPTGVSESDAYRAAPPPSVPAAPPLETSRPAPEPAPSASVAAAAPSAAGGSARAGLWELTGPTGRDRFGLALIGLGIVAVLYAVLTQLRLG
jgi:hypothetical protein